MIMRKTFTIVGVIAIIYLVLAGILNGSGMCPKYVDMMPRIDGPQLMPARNVLIWKLTPLFCPFIERVW